MWSHKWTIPTWTSAEGVKVADYNISPGLWGISGDEAGHIGVVSHELGHFFGLPDLYDTGGGSQGVGNWDLMAGGAWGFDGSQQYPSHMSAWSKSKLGWLSPQPILPGSFVAPQVETSPSVFRIDCGYPPGELVLVENRQQVGFDGALPQGGLAIWHVDESKGSFGNDDPDNDEGYPGQLFWPNNGRHYRVALLQADGAYDMEMNFNRGDAWDIYHGAGTSSITQTSVPDLQAYQQGLLIANGNRIENVALSSASMTFDYANPLRPSLTTASLPVARVGKPWSASLAASGGSAPLVWSEYVADPSYAVSDTGASGFAAVGVAQGWQADEGTWAYDLPFRFPYWETSYARVYVSSNGFVDLVPGEPEPYTQSNFLRTSTRIAPLWMDLDTTNGDVFVDASQPGSVTFRWAAETFGTSDAVNVAVTPELGRHDRVPLRLGQRQPRAGRRHRPRPQRRRRDRRRLRRRDGADGGRLDPLRAPRLAPAARRRARPGRDARGNADRERRLHADLPRHRRAVRLRPEDAGDRGQAPGKRAAPARLGQPGRPVPDDPADGARRLSRAASALG